MLSLKVVLCAVFEGAPFASCVMPRCATEQGISSPLEFVSCTACCRRSTRCPGAGGRHPNIFTPPVVSKKIMDE